ncbi:MAG: type I restriction enzyme HsdR N-terminal domain-containing protein, partial [Actinobacteria bacterium]|nr:type I restriction enzyme HsdR N-terminal domain-containing protein [Actinomycetota bacterium]
MCEARRILVCDKPEESVRQKTIRMLVETYRVPTHCIDAELPVPNSRRRADIVVFNGPKPQKHAPGPYGQPILVIECKGPGVGLDDDHRTQLLYYATSLSAPFAVLTNGTDVEFYEPGKGILVKPPITLEFKHLLTATTSQPVPPPTPWTPVAAGGQVIGGGAGRLRQCGIMGEDTRDGLAPVVGWLADIIFDDSQRFTILPGVNLLQDGGIRTITPSNAGGGSWFG